MDGRDTGTCYPESQRNICTPGPHQGLAGSTPTLSSSLPRRYHRPPRHSPPPELPRVVTPAQDFGLTLRVKTAQCDRRFRVPRSELFRLPL